LNLVLAKAFVEQPGRSLGARKPRESDGHGEEPPCRHPAQVGVRNRVGIAVSTWDAGIATD
jgi:hypothetical protein